MSLLNFKINRANTLDDLSDSLEWLLKSKSEVIQNIDGSLKYIESEQRVLVDRIGSLKIEIYYDEHPPPHFHVKTAEINASLRIIDCELIEGEIDRSSYKKVKYWHSIARDKLINFWNNSRPSNCSVGPIKL